jgi:hypothetical protein
MSIRLRVHQEWRGGVKTSAHGVYDTSPQRLFHSRVFSYGGGVSARFPSGDVA